MKEEKKKVIKKCICGNSFEAYRKWQKHCSSRCRWKQWDKNNPRTKLSVEIINQPKERTK